MLTKEKLIKEWEKQIADIERTLEKMKARGRDDLVERLEVHKADAERQLKRLLNERGC